MTKQQLDDANAMVERIKRLEKIYDQFVSIAVNFDESLVRMTSFNIVNDRKDFNVNLNQSEILFLTEALNNEIQRLKMEFCKI